MLSGSFQGCFELFQDISGVQKRSIGCFIGFPGVSEAFRHLPNRFTV